jgi:hypothetical protein
MKLVTLCVIAILGTELHGSETTTRVYTREWLEKGCISIMVLDKDRDNWTKEQEKIGLHVSSWLNGFLVGVNAMCLAGEEKLELTFPPDDWLDSRVLAPKIVAFCKQHDRIPGDAYAREVMVAWYYLSHPKANAQERIIGEQLLRKLEGLQN